MCEKPKDGNENAKSADKKAQDRSYYYDDAHGYEDFDPEMDEPDADEDESP